MCWVPSRGFLQLHGSARVPALVTGLMLDLMGESEAGHACIFTV